MRVLQELNRRRMNEAGDDGEAGGGVPAGEGSGSFDAFLESVVSGDVNGDGESEISTADSTPGGDEPSDVTPAAPVTPAPAPATPTTTDGATPPVAPSTTPAQPTPSPAPQPVTTPPTPTDVATPPVVDPVLPAPTAEEVAAQRTAVMQQLATRYAIPEDMAPRLVTEPEKALPELFANVHAQIMDNVQAYVQGSFAHLLQQHEVTQRTRASNVDKFYAEWPELKKDEYGATVARMVGGYRQANPNATPEDVIREGGLAALIALRLPIPDRIQKQHNANSGNAAPASPPPALGGSAPHSGPISGGASSNVFEIVAQEDVLSDGYTPPKVKH